MKSYFKKLADMSVEERKKYFAKIGSKGGKVSKSRGTDYRALGKKGGLAKAKKLSTG